MLRLLKNGEQFFPRVFSAIQHAERRMLLPAAQRGVKKR